MVYHAASPVQGNLKASIQRRSAYRHPAGQRGRPTTMTFDFPRVHTISPSQKMQPASIHTIQTAIHGHDYAAKPISPGNHSIRPSLTMQPASLHVVQAATSGPGYDLGQKRVTKRYQVARPRSAQMHSSQQQHHHHHHQQMSPPLEPGLPVIKGLSIRLRAALVKLQESGACAGSEPASDDSSFFEGSMASSQEVGNATDDTLMSDNLMKN